MRVGIAMLWLVPLAACGRQAAPPQAAGVELPELARLCERLDRLIGLLERAPAPTTEAGTAPVERTPADADAAALRTRVDELEQELAILRAQVSLRGGALGAAERPHVIPPTRDDAVARMVATVRADGEQKRNDALRAMLLMGPAQVLQTFGMPTDVWFANDGAVKWQYRIGEHDLYVVFVNGMVMRVHD